MTSYVLAQYKCCQTRKWYSQHQTRVSDLKYHIKATQADVPQREHASGSHDKTNPADSSTRIEYATLVTKNGHSSEK